MSFSKRSGKNTPQCYTKPLDSLKNWNNRAPNPAKVKTGTRHRTAHEVSLLTATANRMIDMEDTVGASESSGTPSTLEKSPLDFANEDPPQMIAESGGAEGQSVMNWHMETHLQRMYPRRRILVPVGLDTGSTVFMTATQDSPTSVSDPDPLSYAKPQPHHELDIAQSSGRAGAGPDWKCCDHKGSGPVFREESGVRDIILLSLRGWVARGYLSAGVGHNQQLPHGYPRGMPRHGRPHSTDGVTEKATTKIARRDRKIQAREKEIKRLDHEIKSFRAVEAESNGLRNQTKNLKTMLEAKVDMKKAVEARNAKLAKELESLCV
uniref:Uncharacterized protein n=1 Tax=Tanacetum cinerariifolium TaxID=118510 RepID=A0A699LD39_TANCI|nr:hypothetical protein [Tanacetum cinerariifolium]